LSTPNKSTKIYQEKVKKVCIVVVNFSK